MSRFQKSTQVITDTGIREKMDIAGQIVVLVCLLVIIFLVFLGVMAIIHIV